MVLSGIIVAGIIIGYIVAWVFVLEDVRECRKCEWQAVCMNSTLSHHCPRRNYLSPEERREIEKKINESDD